ncbi:MAG: hypothetical protein AB7F78_24470 [Hyphomicrobiaceae bacterium]
MSAARLAKIARVLAKTPYWTGGATHSIETSDAGLFGVGTEVYFLATEQARPGDSAVFLHRTKRKAIERRLVKATKDGWTVWRVSSEDGRGTAERLDAKTWCGGFRAVASLMPKARHRRLAKAAE